MDMETLSAGIEGIEYADLKQRLEKAGVQHVRLAFVDNGNILRFRVLPLNRFIRLLVPGTNHRGVFASTARLGVMSYKDILVSGLPPGIGAVGEIALIPDLSSFRPLPYGSGNHAICMVNFEEKDHPISHPGCLRTCLSNIVKSAENNGLSFLVGFESEVTFLSNVDPPTPIDYIQYGSSACFHSETVWKMMDEIVAVVTEQGIGVSAFHKECAPGQYEVVTDPYPPMAAVDALILTRETIFNIGAKYNFKATFAPKLFNGVAGCGAHCHISIKGIGHNYEHLKKGPLSPPGISGLEERFMAGILKHMRAIAAFTLPNVTSYDRIESNQNAGVYVAWGVDNREASLRLAYVPHPNLAEREFNLELKCMDGTANPYLAVAAIMTAGLDGIYSNIPLTMQELKVSPGTLSEDELVALGITTKLPSSIEESLTELKSKYELFEQSMGKYLLDIYTAVRAADTAHMRSLSKQQQLQLVIKHY